MIITTGRGADPTIVKRAEDLSRRTNNVYIPRMNGSLARLAAKHKNEDVIVVLEQGARLFRSGQLPMEFHPSMGFVRAKRILKGEYDPMLDSSGITLGNTVLDCTAGLGTDSLVFAVKAGPSGSVTAIESSEALSVLLMEGLATYSSDNAEVNEAMRRISVRHGHHLDVLRSMPDASFDIVYFDPMFREPMLESASISPLRSFANPDALSEESIAEAIRVARKTVVLKEKRGSSEFARLGFTSDERQSKIAYGVISVDSAKHN
ncbi:class I SAM-dependent methyltransferase [Paenibacillus pini]|uniref:Protein-L-isoD(D-D) O-methyltransferase n=1 Tax=Paenibacillus pini JCM 16418 TaxID=1236976 RepID=W7YTV8_9BACL|nr:class I SAM-dependent methyltransferase [Paenibacillus pini]GAF10613.1 protein-L-isoD(D-D) O-methyltransferase [Paenibacillus pini JCM 16418]